MKDHSTAMSIGQFSSIVKLSVRMLRYYDDHGIVHPAYVDEWTGYRYYTAEQLTRAVAVRDLRDIGLNVAEIAAVLRAPSEKQRQELLRQQQQQLERTLGDIKGQLRLCQRLIQGKDNTMTTTISRNTIPAMHLVTLTRVVPTYADEGQLWATMKPLLAEQRITPIGPCGVIEHCQEYQERDVTLSIFVPVPAGTAVSAPLETMVFPERECVVARVVGPYSGIADAHDAIAAYMAEHNLGCSCAGDLADRAFNLYLNDAGATPEEQLLTEVHVPICCTTSEPDKCCDAEEAHACCGTDGHSCC